MIAMAFYIALFLFLLPVALYILVIVAWLIGSLVVDLWKWATKKGVTRNEVANEPPR